MIVAFNPIPTNGSKDIITWSEELVDELDVGFDGLSSKPLKYPSPAPSGITNLNDNKLLGTIFHASPTVANIPLSGSHHIVLTFGINTSYYAQIAIHGALGDLKSRAYNNGTWTSWK